MRFESNNEQVATVTQEGLVQMTGGYGTAVITASAVSGASARFTVNVVTQLPETGAEPTALPENAAPYEEMYNELQGGEDDDGIAPGEEVYGGDMIAEVYDGNAPEAAAPTQRPNTVG